MKPHYPDTISCSVNLAGFSMAELVAILQDPIKRICTLYTIRDDKGVEQQFRPKPEQMEVLHEIFVKGNKKILIIKARQLGMSTLLGVIIADHITFNAGQQCSIVDQKLADAGLKLRGKVRMVFDSLPKIMRSHDSEFSLRRTNLGGESDTPSSCFAGTNARGGTNQILHISEWGPIQHNDPPRSKEILTGALPSAEEGLSIVETTWMGGKRGELWELTKTAMLVKAKPELKTTKDYTLLFFPWWNDPKYRVSGNMARVTPYVWEYFKEMQKHPDVVAAGHVFDHEQILWYETVAMSKGDERYREYPSVLEEAFLAPVPGAIWQKYVEAARKDGRILNFPHDATRLVYTFWDLGSPTNTRVVYCQFVDGMIHVLDHDTGLDMLPAARVAHMAAKGYSFGTHFFPHDGGRKEYSGITFAQQMQTAGLVGIQMIPRTREVWVGINEISGLFHRFVINEDKCVDLVESMSCYHTRLSDNDKPTSEVVHDDASHDCDAVRYIAEALHANLVSIGANYKHLIQQDAYSLGQKPVQQAALHGSAANWYARSRNQDGRVLTGGYKFRR